MREVEKWNWEFFFTKIKICWYLLILFLKRDVEKWNWEFFHQDWDLLIRSRKETKIGRKFWEESLCHTFLKLGFYLLSHFFLKLLFIVTLFLKLLFIVTLFLKLLFIFTLFWSFYLLSHWSPVREYIGADMYSNVFRFCTQNTRIQRISWFRATTPDSHIAFHCPHRLFSMSQLKYKYKKKIKYKYNPWQPYCVPLLP